MAWHIFSTPSRLRGGFRLLGVGALGALLALLAARLVFQHTARTHNGLGPLHDQLIALAEGQRPLEARLSGFEVQAPCAEADLPRCKPLPEPNSQEFISLKRYNRQLRLTIRDEPGIEQQHTWGLALLFQARHAADAERVIEVLGALVHDSPRNPGLLSDLAAAWLTRAGFERSASGLVAAFNYSTQALEIEPDHPAAAFNRALALSRLHLPRAATEAGKKVLDHEQDPAWRAEALARWEATLASGRHHRWQDLRAELPTILADADSSVLQELIGEYPEEFLEYLENDQLTAWALATGEAGSETAGGPPLQLITHLAASLQDDLLVDTVAAISRRSTANLAQAHRTYAKAKSLYTELRDLDQARRQFSAAAEIFRQAGSPFQLWSRYYGAVCAFYLEDSTHALSTLTALRAESAKTPYRRFRGYVDWMIGLIHTTQGEYGLGIAAYRSAQEHFRVAALPSRQARIHILLADALKRINEPAAAWDELHPALDFERYASDPKQRRAAYQQAAEVLSETGNGALVSLYMAEAMEATQQEGTAAAAAEVLYLWAEIDHRLERDAAAIQHLEEARRWLGAVTDAKVARLVDAGIARVEGLVGIDPWAGDRLDRLSEAIEYFSQVQAHALLPELLLHRARRSQLAGRLAEAEGDLLRGAEVTLAQRRQLPQAQWRVSFGSSFRDLIEGILRLRLDAGRPWDQILPWTDLLRDAAYFMPQPDSTVEKDVEPWDSLGNLPPDTALISYTLLKNSILLWSDHAGQVTLREVVVDEERLALQIERARQLQLPWHATAEARRVLFETLITPLHPDIVDAQRWIIAADRQLHQVPFAVLLDPSSGRFLVEDHTLAFTPSARVFLQRQETPVCLPLPQHALVVGAPQLNPRRLAELGDLPQASKEARAVASLYPHATLLTARQATPARILEELRSATIFHFAGHALDVSEAPEAARLILAGDTAAQPVGLFANSIRDRDLCHLELVVLSACRTASSPEADAAGILSLAAAFLAAGAQGVVASDIPLDDSLASDLLTAFHHELLQGQPAIEALHQIQLRALRNPAHPTGDWAGLRFLTTGQVEPSTPTQEESP